MTGEPGAAGRTADAVETAEVAGTAAEGRTADAVGTGEAGRTAAAAGAAEAGRTAGGVGAAEAGTGTGAEPAPSGAGGGTETGTDSAAAPSAGARPQRSRRFPLFTKDTARPEGGGRAASGDAPAPARQWPVLTVLLLFGLGLLLTAFDFFRAGTLLAGLGLIGGALMRWALPSVGMLAVRSRFTDMVTYGVLGVVIALLAMMAQPHPWLEIPFLDDMLHFTIK
ncbi:DUF3017 domain-containing protein [Streptomyces sp. TS71-3]|uniref:DUF3017 domain-containing protein n=1 Tax=Streptomyces sp. TS71-3 TaxID=2733862 RepID=UPI001B12752B|nr:DUF3017 domain-containing protein [Streptomyces sp. TS71-3]GHJ35096.1 hypothetical protein Sm713_07050 [Streptomyces sp. TS71-3]